MNTATQADMMERPQHLARAERFQVTLKTKTYRWPGEGRTESITTMQTLLRNLKKKMGFFKTAHTMGECGLAGRILSSRKTHCLGLFHSIHRGQWHMPAVSVFGSVETGVQGYP